MRCAVLGVVGLACATPDAARPDAAAPTVVPDARMAPGLPEIDLIEYAETERFGDYVRVILPTLGGVISEAIGVDDEGVVVGWALEADGTSRAVRWVDGEIAVIEELAAPSEVRGVNGRGDLVAAVDARTVVWVDGVVHETDFSWAEVITEDGMIVGDGPEDRVLLWRDGVQHDVGPGLPVGVTDDGTVFIDDYDENLWRWREGEGLTEVPRPDGVERGYMLGGDGLVIGRTDAAFVAWDGAAWSALDVDDSMHWCYTRTRTGWMWCYQHPDDGDGMYLRRPDGFYIYLEHPGKNHATPSMVLDDGTAMGSICSGCENLIRRPVLWRSADGGAITDLGPLGHVWAGRPEEVLVGLVPADPSGEYKRAAIWRYDPL